MNPTNQFTPFVVFGPSKSGTTWMQKMLDAHPQLRCHFQLPIFEFSDGGQAIAQPGNAVFSQLKNPFKEIFDGKEEAQYWVRLRFFQRLRPALEQEIVKIKQRFPEANHPAMLRETLLETYRAVAERFLKDSNDKSYYGTKATTDLAFFFELYPQGKVIGILRDGRDVAVSKRFHMQRRGAFYHGDEKSRWLYALNHYRPSRLLVQLLQKRWGWFGEKHYRKYNNDNMQFVPAALQKFATDWSLTVSYLLSFYQTKPKQVLLVRYEEMKKNQVHCLAQIFDFLNVSNEPKTIKQIIEATDFNKMKKKNNDNSFFRKGVVGDWKNYFSESDKSLFKKVAGDTLIKTGYENDYNW